MKIKRRELKALLENIFDDLQYIKCTGTLGVPALGIPALGVPALGIPEGSPECCCSVCVLRSTVIEFNNRHKIKADLTSS